MTLIVLALFADIILGFYRHFQAKISFDFTRGFRKIIYWKTRLDCVSRDILTRFDAFFDFSVCVCVVVKSGIELNSNVCST